AVLAVQFYGQEILSIGADATLRLFDMADGGKSRLFTGHTASLLGAAFSPERSLLASISLDGTARLWDTKGNGVFAMRASGQTFTAVRFSRSGHFLAIADDNAEISVFDLSCLSGFFGRSLPEREALRSKEEWLCGPPKVLRGHGGPISQLVFSSDESYLYSA